MNLISFVTKEDHTQGVKHASVQVSITGLSSTTVNIAHGLDFIPGADLFFTTDFTNYLFPVRNFIEYGGAGTPLVDKYDQISIEFSVNSTDLSIPITNNNSSARTVTIYYFIYRDRFNA